MLHIVSTPIGNLNDITYRAVDTLKTVDLIAAEDTRHTRVLCQHYNITTPLTSYFEHNKYTKARQIVKQMLDGKSVALVTDAGTPGVSDPGYRLINLAKENDITITVVPGPTALIAALSLSGLPSDRFIFEGFLPVKAAARQKRMRAFKEETRTVIFYESVHRILKTLQDCVDVLDDPVIFCGRELTKKFEEGLTDKASALIQHFERHRPRGEFVLILPRA